jgi:hypothetical protein
MARFKSADDKRQSYTSRLPTSKSTFKTTTSSGSGNRQNSNYNQYTAYTPAQVKSGKLKVDKDIAKTKSAELSNYQVKKVPAIIPGSTILNSLTKERQKSFEGNKNYFRENVVGKLGYEDTLDSYTNYMTKRGAGTADAMGRTISNGSGNGNTQPGITKNIGGSTMQTTAPTTAEVSQEQSEAAADAEANRLLKIKKRGRSQSILSGSQGVTKMAADYSLGKKSLLGRV